MRDMPVDYTLLIENLLDPGWYRATVILLARNAPCSLRTCLTQVGLFVTVKLTSHTDSVDLTPLIENLLDPNRCIATVALIS